MLKKAARTTCILQKKSVCSSIADIGFMFKTFHWFNEQKRQNVLVQVLRSSRFSLTKPPAEGRQGIYTHEIYILIGMSFHVFQSQGYLVAIRTEWHQPIGYLGSPNNWVPPIPRVLGGRKYCVLAVHRVTGAETTESRQSTGYPVAKTTESRQSTG